MNSMKTVLFVLAFSTLFFVSGAFASTILFQDVPEDHWAADAIQWAHEKGIMTGPGNQSELFVPDGVVTRDQLAAVLYRFQKTLETNTFLNDWEKVLAPDLGISIYYPEEVEYHEVSPKHINPYFERLNEKDISTRKITYGVPGDGLGEWALSKEVAEKLKEVPSCETLSSFASQPTKLDTFYLPPSFSPTNMCDVITNDNMIIFYTIGKGETHEGYPTVGYLNSNILILKEEHAFLLRSLLGSSHKITFNNKLDESIIEFYNNHPNMHYPDENFKELDKKINRMMEEELSQPSFETFQSWEILEMIVKSIEEV